jgi:hypothetical protein
MRHNLRKPVRLLMLMLTSVCLMSNAQNPTYLWSNGATTQSINVTPQVGTMYYVDITFNGTVYHDSVFVDVLGALPAPTAINGPSGGCAGQNNVVLSTPSIPGATQYNWTLPPGVTGSSNTETISLNFSSSFVTGTISVSADNGVCASAPFSRSLLLYTAKPNVPGLITGPTSNVCSGTIHPFSVAPVANATSYTWTIPAGCSIVSGAGTNAIQVSVPTGFVSGTISVSASNCIGTSSIRLLTIRGLPSAPGTITGAVSGVCQGSTVIYSISPVIGATSYVWTGPAGSTVLNQGSTSAQITFPAGFVSGNVSVQAQNSCGTGASRILSVRSIPLTPTSLTGQVNNLCSNFPYLYTATASPDVTNFQWTVPGGASFTQPTLNTASVTFPPSALTGNITVAASNFCGSSAPRSISVTTSPATPTVISGPSSVCAQQLGVSYSVNPVNGANVMNWQVPAGATIAVGQGTPSVIVDFGNTSGFVRVQATNACASGRVVQKAVSFGCRTEEGETEDVEFVDAGIVSGAASGIFAFPNPANNELFLQCGDALLKQNPMVSLLDVLGRDIMSFRISSNQSLVDIRHLPAGLYFLRVHSEGVPVVRIIKE